MNHNNQLKAYSRSSQQSPLMRAGRLNQNRREHPAENIFNVQ